MKLIITVLEELPKGNYRVKIEGYSDGKEIEDHEYIEPRIVEDIVEANPQMKVGDRIILDGDYKVITLKSPNLRARILAKADIDFSAYLDKSRTN